MISSHGALCKTRLQRVVVKGSRCCENQRQHWCPVGDVHRNLSSQNGDTDSSPDKCLMRKQSQACHKDSDARSEV